MKQNLDRVKEQFTELLQLNSQNQKIYLVGGVVRDQILGRKKKDIDILCEKDSRSIAKHWAEIKRGAFYILDEQRNTCRVILNEAGQKTIYDFATQQGHDLLDDLSARDFTLNAMAIEFSAPDVLIDPLGGIADIEHSLLKACSAASFSSDPVRTIRAIRYANAYQLKIDPDTLQSLKVSISDLTKISVERKRDELFKVLDLLDPVPAVIALQDLGILAKIGYPLISAENLAIARMLSSYLRVIENNSINQVEVNEFIQLQKLQNYFQNYKQLLLQKNTSDRNLHQLLLLVTLFLGLDSMRVREKAQQSLLSNDEISRLMTLMAHQQDFELLAQRIGTLMDRDFYLFFNQVDIAGLDLALLALAQQTSISPKQVEENYFTLAENVFNYWFEKQNVIKPQLLLNGKEIMMNFDLSSGPAIGKLLDKLREEQAAGTILTREKAMIWMEEQVNQLVDQRRWDRSQSK